jgi:hypothetical protein
VRSISLGLWPGEMVVVPLLCFASESARISPTVFGITQRLRQVFALLIHPLRTTSNFGFTRPTGSRSRRSRLGVWDRQSGKCVMAESAPAEVFQRVGTATRPNLTDWCEGISIEGRSGKSLDALRHRATADRLALATECRSRVRLLETNRPMFRDAISCYYCCLYRAFRAALYFHAEGDDHQEHKALAGGRPRLSAGACAFTSLRFARAAASATLSARSQTSVSGRSLGPRAGGAISASAGRSGVGSTVPIVGSGHGLSSGPVTGCRRLRWGRMAQQGYCLRGRLGCHGCSHHLLLAGPGFERRRCHLRQQWHLVALLDRALITRCTGVTEGGARSQ